MMEELKRLEESIKENGLISPVLVRPKPDGRYEIVSGHRRLKAFKNLKQDKIRCIVKTLTNDEAVIAMVDSNLQREHILPSEKAFAYKMKLDAIKHSKKNLANVAKNSRDELSKKLKDYER